MECKYIAWHKQDKKFLYDYEATNNGYFTTMFKYRRSEVDVLPYIGFKDKNKKDIYMGYILKDYSNKIWRLETFDDLLEMYYWIKECVLYADEEKVINDLEIIGTIYD